MGVVPYNLLSVGDLNNFNKPAGCHKLQLHDQIFHNVDIEELRQETTAYLATRADVNAMTAGSSASSSDGSPMKQH